MSKKGKVGYCSPPKQHQWKKGQSGNPSGKAKKCKAAPAAPVAFHLAEQLSEVIEITQNGKKKKVTVSEAVAIKMTHELMAAPLAQKLKTLAMFAQMGVFDKLAADLEEAEDDSIYDEEAKRLVEIVGRELFGDDV